MRRLSTKVAAAVFACSLLLSAASANEGQTDDPADTGGKLDLANIAHGHGDQKSLLKHTIRMHTAWSNDVLDPADPHNGLDVLFNLDEDLHSERRLSIGMAKDGSLVGGMVADRKKKPDRFRGYAFVYRVDETTIEILFPKSLLRKGIDSYAWAVETHFHEAGDPDCGDVSDVTLICFDRAPDTDGLAHKL